MSDARGPMRVFVVFEAADVALLVPLAREGDVVFGDIAERDMPTVRHVRPELPSAAVARLSEQTREWFTALRARLGLEVEALINPFFEASILPIATYANALAELLSAQPDPAGVEVVFPRRTSSGRRTSTYLLAEHEVHRRFLYRRHQIFQPYLEDLCSRLGIAFRSLPNGRDLLPMSVTLPVRRYGTLATRIVAALVKAATSPRLGGAVIPAVDVVGVARNPSKSEFLHPLLTLPALRSCLVVGETFMSFRRNARFAALLYEGTATRLVRLPSPGIARVLRTYARTWRSQESIDPACAIETGAVTIRLANAVREMLVTYPDAEIHAVSLRDVLTRVRPSHRIVLSTEQKSQYAWADAHAARATGNLCFHLMEVDQSDRPLPSPVFGDLFVASSLQHKERFQAGWPRQRDRVAYFGALKPWLPDRESGGTGAPSRWCFFTSAAPELDRRVLGALAPSVVTGEVSLMVKLHPRDSILHYGAFPRSWFVKDGEMSKQRLFERFDFGLAFSSAIIADLFSFAKPFLLLDIAEEEFFNESVHRERLTALRVTSTGALRARMRDVAGMKRVYRAYRAAYLADLGGATGAAAFLAEMSEAARRLRGASTA
jgi:hypothetical protein